MERHARISGRDLIRKKIISAILIVTLSFANKIKTLSVFRPTGSSKQNMKRFGRLFFTAFFLTFLLSVSQSVSPAFGHSISFECVCLRVLSVVLPYQLVTLSYVEERREKVQIVSQTLSFFMNPF